MSIWQKIEKKLTNQVNETVAKIFKEKIVPEELAFALQKEAALSVQKTPKGEIAADLYAIALSPVDFNNEELNNEKIAKKLHQAILSTLKKNNWNTYNPVKVDLVEEYNLKAGQFRLASRITNQSTVDSAKLLEDSQVNLSSLSENHEPKIRLILTNINTGAETLVNQFPFLIGRNEIADLSIKNSSVSRIHAQITNTPLGVELTDVDSLNGTKLNGNPVKAELLKNDDIISIAEEGFRVEIIGNNGKSTSHSEHQ